VDNTGVRDDGAAHFAINHQPSTINCPMTVDELIAETLNKVRNFFYADRLREFKRDERALMKAVLRYGHECHQRGWEFDAEFIYREVSKVLQSIRTGGSDVQYLPVYLDGAMKRAVGGRSEELQVEAKARRANPVKLVSGLNRVQAVIEKSAAQTCSEVFTALAAQQRARRAARKPKRHIAEQKTFL